MQSLTYYNISVSLSRYDFPSKRLYLGKRRILRRSLIYLCTIFCLRLMTCLRLLDKRSHLLVAVARLIASCTLPLEILGQLVASSWLQTLTTLIKKRRYIDTIHESKLGLYLHWARWYKLGEEWMIKKMTLGRMCWIFLFFDRVCLQPLKAISKYKTSNPSQSNWEY